VRLRLASSTRSIHVTPCVCATLDPQSLPTRPCEIYLTHRFEERVQGLGNLTRELGMAADMPLSWPTSPAHWVGMIACQRLSIPLRRITRIRSRELARTDRRSLSRRRFRKVIRTPPGAYVESLVPETQSPLSAPKKANNQRASARRLSGFCLPLSAPCSCMLGTD
jgi:hypothetical protein